MPRFLPLLLFALVPAFAHAQSNVDLSTVPKRDTVQLTIYNSEDLTLVRETRALSLKKGANPLQFSWANTLIDPTSVELRFLSHVDELDVLDTTFPHAKPQMLYWNVQSDFDGEAIVEITYFTSGVTWTADYLCLADREEKQLNVEGFVRVQNNSGEEYDDAQVRLVVGTINLVEKIAELARIPANEVDRLDRGRFESLKKDAAKDMFFFGRRAGGYGGGKAEELDAKQIVKQGLSEYFIYTIEGTETIPNGWSKRLRSFEAAAVPMKIQYRYRPAEYGEQLVRMYLLTNDKPSKLGTTPLPDGVVRVFRDNGRDGLSYLTQQSIKYVPIGDKIELNLGADPEVVFELVKLRSVRDDVWMQINGTNRYRRPTDNEQLVVQRSSVAGWDERETFAQRIRNYTSKPVDVEIRRTLPGHVVFRSSLMPVLHDYQTVQFQTTVPAGKKQDLLFETVRKQGYNAKQNNVTLETAEIVR